jgi:hypothetical protein
VSEDGSHNRPESERAEFIKQAERLRALASDASTASARQHFVALAETYDRLAATCDRSADAYSGLGVGDSSGKPTSASAE